MPPADNAGVPLRAGQGIDWGSRVPSPPGYTEGPLPPVSAPPCPPLYIVYPLPASSLAQDQTGSDGGSDAGVVRFGYGMEEMSSLGASSSALPPLGQSPAGFRGLGVLPPAVQWHPLLLRLPAPGFGGQWQFEMFLQQVEHALHPIAAAQAELLRLEAKAEQRAAVALQAACQEEGSPAQACAEALTASRARTKADPQSDDDELPGAALAAERLPAFNLALRTNSSEADFTYTGSNWAVHKRRRLGPSMTFSSATTSLDEVHSSFMPEE